MNKENILTKVEDSTVTIFAKHQENIIKKSTKIENNIHDNNYSTSIGTIFHNNNNIYVVGCYHGMINAIDIIMYFKIKKNNKNILEKCKLNILSYSIELDISLLEIINPTKNIINGRFINTDMLITKLSNTYNNIEFNFKNLHEKNTIISCKFKKIKYDNLHSFHTPKLPYINTKIEKCKNIMESLQGKSGSLVVSDNKIIGMISNLSKNNELEISPSIFLIRFLAEYNKIKCFNGLCNIIFTYEECSTIYKKKKINAIKIIDNYDINYNMEHFTQVNNAQNIKKDDILIKIDNNFINNKCQVFDKELNLNIDLHTYITLRYHDGDKINLIINRYVGELNNKRIETKKITVLARSMETLKYISIENNKYHKFGNLILTELSEQLIEYCRCNNIILENTIFKYYVDKPYRNENEKIIILLNLDTDMIYTENINLDKKISFVSKINKYKMPILKKINRLKIKRLDDVLNKDLNVMNNLTIELSGETTIIRTDGIKIENIIKK